MSFLPLSAFKDAAGKASDLYHRWPDQIDNSKPELNPYCLSMYV